MQVKSFNMHDRMNNESWSTLFYDEPEKYINVRMKGMTCDQSTEEERDWLTRFI